MIVERTFLGPVRRFLRSLYLWVWQTTLVSITVRRPHGRTPSPDYTTVEQPLVALAEGWSKRLLPGA